MVVRYIGDKRRLVMKRGSERRGCKRLRSPVFERGKRKRWETIVKSVEMRWNDTDS